MAYEPISMLALSVAFEIERRAKEQPDLTLLAILENILNEKPVLGSEAVAKRTQMVNDLLGLASPDDDKARMILIMALPQAGGIMFTATDILMSDVILIPGCPVMNMANHLAKSIAPQWPQFRKAAELLRVILPKGPHIAGADGLPLERLPRAQAGPENIQNFLPPSDGAPV
jgi:hypothetical protein